MAVATTPNKYAINDRRPNSLPTTPSVAMLVAGPASMNTSIEPGDTPANSSPAAIGVDAVAQMYMGIDTSTITVIARIPWPYDARSSVGTKVCTTAAKNIPTTNHCAVSAMSLPVEKWNAVLNLSTNVG